MNIDSKYVISGLRKSISSNLKTMILLIPFIILITTFVLSVILPTYNHFVFIKNGNHNFIYGLDDEKYKETGNEIEAIYYDRNISSFHDPRLDQSKYNVYYRYSQMVSLFICKDSIDVNKTMFSDKNMLKSVHYSEPNVWLSYELAKGLHVDIGDDVYIRFVFKDNFKDMPIKVSGISRTKYRDDKPVKSNTIVGNAMVFMDDATFNWFLNNTDEGRGSRVLFSDKEIPEFKHSLLHSKEAQLKMTDEFVDKNYIKAMYVIASGIILIYIVLSLDMSYTLKRHNKNMVVLNMLGAPIKIIRKIIIKITLLNFSISLIIALIMVKYVFMQVLLSIYVDIAPLLVCFLIYMMAGVSFSIVQSIKLKKL